jgi:hypothetical protein
MSESGEKNLNPFPFGGPKFKLDPPKEPKGVWRFIRGAFIGAGIAVVACIWGNSGVYFVPVFLVVTLLACVDWIRGK